MSTRNSHESCATVADNTDKNEELDKKELTVLLQHVFEVRSFISLIP